mmetsp:Transcript_14/g.15  ORF Transcript_14/g.15 Transcript_14/m.15 type:complete len:361 (+) Transcript_14:10-1092(+)
MQRFARFKGSLDTESAAVAIDQFHSADGSLTYDQDGTMVSIGKTGLRVNGKQASFVESLEDLEDMHKDLGEGTFAVVKKYRHTKTKKVIAVKIMTIDPMLEQTLGKKLVELRTLHASKHKYIVKFYGAFYYDAKLLFLLEYMDCGTLGDVVKRNGPIPENVLSKITSQLLQGLHYLHTQLHIIHRDIKPSNILVNTKGILKITDFGVSGELAHTHEVARTFVGTIRYMSPSRIQGKEHSSKTDIWSLGLTIGEAALGYFPYRNSEGDEKDNEPTLWDTMQTIVHKPPPTLPADKFSEEFCAFFVECLNAEDEKRPDCATLLESSFIKKYETEDLDVARWMRHLLKKLGAKKRSKKSESKK